MKLVIAVTALNSLLSMDNAEKLTGRPTLETG